MTHIESAIHHNRDENSFTARLFERLILKFENDNNFFNTFIKTIKDRANHNKSFINNLTLTPPDYGNLKYIDGMPFMENIDLYSYCKNNNLNIDFKEEVIDKTEFDYIIVAEDEKQQQIIIVFEVKCFSDLKNDEIIRQNNLLQKYQKAGLYNRFYHIALISHENLVNATVIKIPYPNTLNFSIVTWDDVKEYVDNTRIKREIEFSKLHRTVSYDGKRSNQRKLISGL